jgi:hypothetical protein
MNYMIVQLNCVFDHLHVYPHTSEVVLVLFSFKCFYLILPSHSSTRINCWICFVTKKSYA